MVVLLILLLVECFSHFVRHSAHLQDLILLFVHGVPVVLDLGQPVFVGDGQCCVLRHLSLVVQPVGEVVLAHLVVQLTHG